MKRERYIDIARGIAIILVVMSHCDNFSGSFSISKFSNLFFMPLFIFISGYFSKENKINSFGELINHLKKKISKLYIFYLKWEFIFLILTNIFFSIGFYSSSISYGGKIINPIDSFLVFCKKVIEILLFMGREPFCGAFWFIVTLIFIIIGYSLINYIVNKKCPDEKETNKQLIIGAIVFVLYIIGCIMCKTINIKRVSPAFTLTLFYYFGYMANYYKKNIKFNNIIIFLVSLFLLIILYNSGSVSMNENRFPDGVFLLLSSVSGIYLCFFVSKIIDKTRVFSKSISYVGKNTLPIIALHFISFKIVMLLQYKIGYINYNEIAYLNGYNNCNIFYILYVFVGIIVPLIYNTIVVKLKKMIIA